MDASNTETQKWANTNSGGLKIYPSLARDDNIQNVYTYSVTFPDTDKDKNWKEPSSQYGLTPPGLPNGWPIVYFTTLKKVFNDVFALYDRDENGNAPGNSCIAVKLVNLHVLYSDEAYNRAAQSQFPDLQFYYEICNTSCWAVGTGFRFRKSFIDQFTKQKWWEWVY